MIASKQQSHESGDRAAFLDFAAMVGVVEQWSLKGQTAFIVAAMLRSNGIDARAAQRIFDDGLRRLQ